MDRISVRTIAIIAIAGLAPAVASCGYDAIPTKRERAEAAWADVQVQYQRRADLIARLVATVQETVIVDPATLARFNDARSRASSVRISPDALGDPAALGSFKFAQGQLTGELSSLLASVEVYPQVQSNPNFANLQSQLEGTENRITTSMRDYNEAVVDYNVSLQAFPTIVWARTFQSGHREMQQMSVSAKAQPVIRTGVSAGQSETPGPRPLP